MQSKEPGVLKLEHLIIFAIACGIGIGIAFTILTALSFSVVF